MSVCTDKCPNAPHYHVDNSGPMCDGREEPHPDWCVVKHVVLYQGPIEGLLS